MPPDGFNVGLNLSYRASTMATRIWLEQLQELIDRGASASKPAPQPSEPPFTASPAASGEQLPDLPA